MSDLARNSGIERMNMLSRWMSFLTAAALLASTPALSQQRFVYPARGQSPEQQQRDEFECYQWAVQQTGFDPSRAPQPQAAAPMRA
jgi:hypothetical protein